MWILAILCVAGFLLWQSNKRRAQRFVRAVRFLAIIDDGASADEANGQVARLFTKHSTPDADNAAIRHAMDRANRLTDGKQLPWIHEAREKGFAIDSGDNRLDMAHLSKAQSDATPDQNNWEHFSVGQSYTSPEAHFPHALAMVSGTIYAALEGFYKNKGKLTATIKAITRTAIRWALRGSGVGFVLGWFVPMGELEPLAIPFLIACAGAVVGLAIGAIYNAVRWVYAD